MGADLHHRAGVTESLPAWPVGGLKGQADVQPPPLLGIPDPRPRAGRGGYRQPGNTRPAGLPAVVFG